MFSNRYGFPVIHDNDLICVINGGYALCDDKLRRIRDQFGKALADQQVCLCIYRAGGIIQDQHLRLFQKRPCNTQTLSLPAGNVRSSLFNIGIILVREAFNKFGSLRMYVSSD